MEPGRFETLTAGAVGVDPVGSVRMATRLPVGSRQVLPGPVGRSTVGILAINRSTGSVATGPVVIRADEAGPGRLGLAPEGRGGVLFRRARVTRETLRGGAVPVVPGQRAERGWRTGSGARGVGAVRFVPVGAGEGLRVPTRVKVGRFEGVEVRGAVGRAWTGRRGVRPGRRLV